MQRGFVSSFRGVCYLASMGAGCVILAHGETKPCMDDAVGGGQSYSPSVSGAVPGLGTQCVHPHPTARPCLLCRPAWWQPEVPAQQIQLCSSGEWGSVCRYELCTNEALRSLSLRHYMLWGGRRINLYSKPAGASPSIYLRKCG